MQVYNNWVACQPTQIFWVNISCIFWIYSASNRLFKKYCKHRNVTVTAIFILIFFFVSFYIIKTVTQFFLHKMLLLFMHIVVVAYISNYKEETNTKVIFVLNFHFSSLFKILIFSQRHQENVLCSTQKKKISLWMQLNNSIYRNNLIFGFFSLYFSCYFIRVMFSWIASSSLLSIAFIPLLLYYYQQHTHFFLFSFHVATNKWIEFDKNIHVSSFVSTNSHTINFYQYFFSSSF